MSDNKCLKNFERAHECVNALAGVENPEQFVRIGKNYINEDKLIRKLINADENERTYDEVERLLKQREELAEQVKQLTEALDTAQSMVRFHLGGLP